MNIAIIGAGNVGGALAARFEHAGHTVTLSSLSGDTAARTAGRTGSRVARSNAEAAAAGDVIVLAVPFATAEAVAKEIAHAAIGKVILDVTNPLNSSFDGLATEHGPSAGELLQEWLPRSRVVKALNTVLAANQADPMIDGRAADGFVASDDAGARDTVLELVRSIGLRPIDVGPLRRARELEALAFLNIWLNATHGWSWTSAWKLLGAPIDEPRPVGIPAHAAA